MLNKLTLLDVSVNLRVVFSLFVSVIDRDHNWVVLPEFTCVWLLCFVSNFPMFFISF